jgi:UDP-perosamine 4-acetyltransferase
MNNDIVVLGASGHAKVIIELLRAMGERVAFCVGGHDSPDNCLGVKVLKGDENLPQLRGQGISRAFVAIGANSVRLLLAEQLAQLGFSMVNAISPHAVVSPSARRGRGIAIMAGAVINADAVIEDLAVINTGTTVDHDCFIGRAVHLAPQCALAGNVIVEEGAFLGVGCKVIPQVRIGANVVLGAGSVVVNDIPAAVTALGIPARIIKHHS